MKFDAKTGSIIAAAAFAALVAGSPLAAAQPVPAVPVPVPLPAPELVPAPGALPGPAPDGTQAVAAGATDPVAEGVPHLMSPENLPPGTTETPEQQNQPRLSYWRDLWHAVQTQEVSGSDALLLLTQRPMIANAAPPAGVPVGPQPPAEAAPAVPAPPLPVTP